MIAHMDSIHSGYNSQACKIKFHGSKNGKPGSVVFVPSQPTKAKTARERAKATTQILFSVQGRGNSGKAVISVGL